jgi:hypothetical protein
MKTFRKQHFPVSEIRRFLEPGPILLVSSAWQSKSNIMTMGWHMVMGILRPSTTVATTSS